jgi:PPOX class probable FMN-dependent enzyme
MSTITTEAELRELYGAPMDRALRKEIAGLEKHSKLFISKSPFVLLATTGPAGADCSPKGDAPGFVEIIDDHTLAIPDRRGNNRVDTLENLIGNPEIGLLFLIPGADDTLRVNGRASLSTDPELLGRFEVRGALPKVVILVKVEQVYLHCAKALIRSRLWAAESQIDRKSLPSFSRMIYEQISQEPDEAEIAASEADYDARNQRTLY